MGGLGSGRLEGYARGGVRRVWSILSVLLGKPVFQGSRRALTSTLGVAGGLRSHCWSGGALGGPKGGQGF